MKQFFLILFGGLLLIGVGIGISYAGSIAWKGVIAWGESHQNLISNLAGVAAAQDNDGTSVSGLRRTIGFQPDESIDLISAASLSLPAGADSKVTAGAYLVEDLDTGEIAARYNQDKILPIASLSKLVTAEVAKKLIPADTRITLTQAPLNTYGDTASLRKGETFTAHDLLYPMLMVSSNDVAEVYAQYYGRAAFLKAMNQFVQSIGAYKTYFADPSGLSPDNVSSASDLAIILDWIRKNDPETLAITETKRITIRSHTWINPTVFLNWSTYLGGKNGYTDEADRTAAALFSLGNPKHTYAVVVLGSDSRNPDVVQLLAKVK